MSAKKVKKAHTKADEITCPRCGLEYGGERAMRMDEPSINGRVGPNVCMCGMVYENGRWLTRNGGSGAKK